MTAQHAVNEANGYEKDHTFYCDETGARVEGAWVKDTEPGVDDDDADADEYWYYFKKATGKARQQASSPNIKGQIIPLRRTKVSMQHWLGSLTASTSSNAKEYLEIGGEDSTAKLSDCTVMFTSAATRMTDTLRRTNGIRHGDRKISNDEDEDNE